MSGEHLKMFGNAAMYKLFKTSILEKVEKHTCFKKLNIKVIRNLVKVSRLGREISKWVYQLFSLYFYIDGISFSDF